MEVDLSFVRKEIVSVMRMKVVARSLIDLPRMMCWMIGEEEFVMVNEVEKAMLVVNNIDVEISRKKMGGPKVKDDSGFVQNGGEAGQILVD